MLPPLLRPRLRLRRLRLRPRPTPTRGPAWPGACGAGTAPGHACSPTAAVSGGGGWRTTRRAFRQSAVQPLGSHHWCWRVRRIGARRISPAGMRTPCRLRATGSRFVTVAHARCCRLTTLHRIRLSRERNRKRQTDLLGLCGLKHAEHKRTITDRARLAGRSSPKRRSARTPADAGLDGARTRMRMDLCRGRPFSSPVRRCRCSATGWRCSRCRCWSFR